MFGNYLSTKEVVSLGLFLILSVQIVHIILTVKLSKNKLTVNNSYTPKHQTNAISGDENNAG